MFRAEGRAKLKRSRKILIVCHCLLNANAKVYPLAHTLGVHSEPLASFLDEGVGFLQLPCPELSYLGVNRWGMTREQYDHPNFRNHCRDILRPSLDQIEAFAQAEYELVGVLGMDGSPNCGINRTCEGFSGGEICLHNNIEEQISSMRITSGRGIFMDVLVELLLSRNIEPKLFAVDEAAPLNPEQGDD